MPETNPPPAADIEAQQKIQGLLKGGRSGMREFATVNEQLFDFAMRGIKKWNYPYKVIIINLNTVRSSGEGRRFKMKRIDVINGKDTAPISQFGDGPMTKWGNFPGVGCKIRIDTNESISDHCTYIYHSEYVVKSSILNDKNFKYIILTPSQEPKISQCPQG